MSGAALEYSYCYASPSEAIAAPGGMGLCLATCGGEAEHPHFFRGRLNQPWRTALLLRGLVEVVQSRFFTPPAMLARILALADPVVTRGGEVLRFEAFSACCSTYGRVDLLPRAVDGEWLGRGTTNVDFNAPLRAALAKIRDADKVTLSVGSDGVELARGAEAVVERKMALPVRWLKGFVEVQAYQARMLRRLEVSGAEAFRFLRALPRSATAGACWVVPARRGLRLRFAETRGGVRVSGIERLGILEDLARHANSLSIYTDPDSHASGWELALDEARFHLVLSPAVFRGLSGEGQPLAELARRRCEDVLPRVRASLQWEATVDASPLSRTFDLTEESVHAALAALGSRGLVGYDLAERAYFHRVLPFDLTLVETLHPRLKNARKLVVEGGVRIVRRDVEGVEAYVKGSDVEQRVRISAESARCSCPWYAKNQGARGPCKHVLAVQITLEGAE
jgi:SWIM zinc finger